MTLTEEQLIDLTGYKRPSSQAKWFKKHFGFTPPRKRFTGALSVTEAELKVKREEIVEAGPKWKVEK